MLLCRLFYDSFMLIPFQWKATTKRSLLYAFCFSFFCLLGHKLPFPLLSHHPKGGREGRRNNSSPPFYSENLNVHVWSIKMNSHHFFVLLLTFYNCSCILSFIYNFVLSASRHEGLIYSCCPFLFCFGFFQFFPSTSIFSLFKCIYASFIISHELLQTFLVLFFLLFSFYLAFLSIIASLVRFWSCIGG